MKILFGICAWGLGHATRTLPIIRKTIEEGHEVTVASSGRALSMLRQELGDCAMFAKVEDYRPPETLYPSLVVPTTLLRFPAYVAAMLRERDFVRRFIRDRKIDVVFSDNRFGFYSREVPSYFMGHQLRILNPLGNGILETGTEIYNEYFFKRYAGVLVPDFEANGLGGRLDHELSVINERRLHYIGILSEFRYHPTVEDVDVFVSISGPEPQRTSFERLVLRQLENIDGRVVVSLGKPEENSHSGSYLKSYLSKGDREKLLNRSKIVVARSGYSTIMDLFSLRKRGFLVPTPGQVEQEYLAEFHMRKKSFYGVPESRLDLPRQLEDALAFHAPTLKCSTEAAVEKAVAVITQTKRPLERAQMISVR